MSARICCLFMLYLTFCCGNIMAQDESMTKLKQFFRNISMYHNMYTQEKVYLHLDNNGYFPGETIWFKAYVVNAGTLLPTDMSKVLYVELLTPEGEVFQRKKYPIKNGRTWGEIKLEDLIHSGYYEIRAYTRAMLNWDEAYIFSRVIPVYDIPKDPLKYGELTLHTNDIDDKAFSRATARPMTEETTQSEHKLLMTFYPEGGYITKGLASRVAFKLINKYGTPLSTPVKLFRADNTEVHSFTPVHEGMGIIDIPTNWNGGYAEVTSASGKTAKFTLPAAREAGCNVTAFTDSTGMTIKAASNTLFIPQTLGVSVTCRGMPCYFDTIQMLPSSICTKHVPRKQLRDGIQQVTVFTSEGEILSERLVWVEPYRKDMQLKVAQNAKTYEAFSPVVLDFTLTDAKGHPQRGEFSLAVHDIDGELAADGADINTELLLSSDLKGYIHKPEYYFETNDEHHRQALDLLMMVQGWRRYAWQEMSGVTPFVLKQPVEEGLLIDGKITDLSSKHRSKGSVDVNLMITKDLTYANGYAKTDAEGNFALMASDFYGDALGFFTTTLNDKRISCSMTLRRGFSPKPVPYDPQALIFDVPDFKEKNADMESALFQWTDTLPRIIHLPEAKVKEKARLHPYGSRFTWMGGENAGKRAATLFYNVEDALEKLLDTGKHEMSLWDWLQTVNRHLVTEIPDIIPPNISENAIGDINEAKVFDPILHYKGRPVRILLDNERPIGSTDFMMSDIRSLAICEDMDTYQRFSNSESSIVNNGVPYVTFLLYSTIQRTASKQRKGQRSTVLHGYSKYEDFYSPNYRTLDTPTPEDVRRTLYWNPNITTDENGKANVVLFSNSRPNERIRVTAQGIAVTGQMFSYK